MEIGSCNSWNKIMYEGLRLLSVIDLDQAGGTIILFSLCSSMAESDLEWSVIHLTSMSFLVIKRIINESINNPYTSSYQMAIKIIDGCNHLRVILYLSTKFPGTGWTTWWLGKGSKWEVFNWKIYKSNSF